MPRGSPQALRPHSRAPTCGRACGTTGQRLLPFTTVRAFPTSSVGTMPSADCCWTVREARASLSQLPWHATSQGIPQLSQGKSQRLLRIDAGFTKQPLRGWRTSWLRTHSSQDCHASYPVRVPRPAPSFHASFRQHLTLLPLRFPCPSPPPGWTEDFPLQALRHARHTRRRSPAAAKTCPCAFIQNRCMAAVGWNGSVRWYCSHLSWRLTRRKSDRSDSLQASEQVL